LYGCSFLPARRQLILRIRLREEGWKGKVKLKGFSHEKNLEKKVTVYADLYHDGTVK
jgi:hypothetical protein